jgi:hypothetical protein
MTNGKWQMTNGRWSNDEIALPGGLTSGTLAV